MSSAWRRFGLIPACFDIRGLDGSPAGFLPFFQVTWIEASRILAGILPVHGLAANRVVLVLIARCSKRVCHKLLCIPEEAGCQTRPMSDVIRSGSVYNAGTATLKRLRGKSASKRDNFLIIVRMSLK
jgi:hypothetical protein